MKHNYSNRAISLVTANGVKCFHCRLLHTIYKCPTFLTISVPDHIKPIAELNLCNICLPQHARKICQKKKCFKCHKAHNTLLHLESRQIEEKNNVSPTHIEISNGATAPTDNLSIATHAIKPGQEYKQVLLSTAVI